MKEILNSVMSKLIKIIIYLRVSSGQQAEFGNSIDGQRIYIQRWAKQNGFHIQKEFCEESSAFQGKRPVFEEMLEYAIENRDIIDGIVVYALSRFARTQKQLISDNSRLEDAGLKLISATEAMPEDEDSAFLMKNVLGTVNELYSRQGSRVVKDRLAVTAEKGFYTGGVVPFGFQSIETNDNDGTRSRKTLIHEPIEAEIVKDVYDLYNNGNSKGEVFSLKKIAKTLNEDGRLKRGKKWAVNDIHRVIKQTVNYGEYQFNSKPKGRPEKSYIIKFPKIIEKETFDIAEKLRNKKNPATKDYERSNSKNLLTGLLKCPCCDCNMVIMKGTSGSHLKKVYSYYECRIKKVEGGSNCTTPNLNMNKVDELVPYVLINELITFERISKILKQLKDLVDAKKKLNSPKLLKLERNAHSVQTKIYTLYEKVSLGNIEVDSYFKNHISDLKKEDHFLKHEIQILKKQSSLPVKKFGDKQINKFISEIKKLLLAPENKAILKRYLSAIIEKITVYDDKAIITGSKLNLAILTSKEKGGTSFEVPPFVSMWR